MRETRRCSPCGHLRDHHEFQARLHSQTTRFAHNLPLTAKQVGVVAAPTLGLRTAGASMLLPACTIQFTTQFSTATSLVPDGHCSNKATVHRAPFSASW